MSEWKIQTEKFERWSQMHLFFSLNSWTMLLCDNVTDVEKSSCFRWNFICFLFFLFHTRIEIVLPMRFIMCLHHLYMMINYRFHCYSFNCMIMLVSFSIRWSRFFFFIKFVLNFEMKEKKIPFDTFIFAHIFWWNSCTLLL